jgi:hypothetical protein
MIERRVAAGERVRLVVGCGGGGQQADVLRVLRHGRQQGDRLEDGGTVGRAVGGEQRRLVHLPHGVAVGQEQQIEQSAFGGLRGFDRVLEVHDIVGPRVLVTPAAEMTAQSEQPCHQVHHEATPWSSRRLKGLRQAQG